MLNKSKSYQIMVWSTVIISFILIGYPILIIFIRSFSSDGFSLANYIEVFSNRKNIEALKNSLFLSTLATIISTIIGCFVAWIISRTKVYFKKIIHALMIVQFFIPPFISAIAWQQILGPVGYVNKLYMSINGSTEPLIDIYGQNGILFVFILSGSVTVYMVVLDTFNKMQASLEEAAVISGANTLQILKDITFPLLKPSILSAVLMVFMSNISNYGVPSVLGFHVSYHTLTTRIYEVIHDFTITNNMDLAAALSMVLVAVAIISVIIKERFLKAQNFTVVTGKPEHLTMHNLGVFNVVLSIVTIFYGLLLSVAPILSILTTSLTRAYGLPFTFENMTLKNYWVIFFQLSSFKNAAKNSLFLAFMAACIAVAIGFIVAYICVRTDFKWKKNLEMLVTLPSAIPGTVMAVAIILAWIKPIPIFNKSLYNTIWIILIAYVANYTAQAFRSLSGGLYQISSSLEEAAEISGATFFQRITNIVIPVMKDNMVTAWFLIFIPCVRELTLSIFLWSVGNETLATVIFTLQDSGNYNAACALSIIIIALISILNFLANHFIKKNNQYA